MTAITNNARCSACDGEFPCTQQQSYPDAGWILPFDTFGYYGGFDDNVQVLTGDLRPRQWILCHDCVVKFLNTFPRLAEMVGPDCHPCQAEQPCCAHAWKTTDSFGKPDSTEPSVLTSWPDSQWHPYQAPEAHG
jgi:hypothetical protein